MRSGRWAAGGLLLALAACSSTPKSEDPVAKAQAPANLSDPVDAQALRPVSAFAGVKDEAARSRLLFSEMARVLTHPRCANCHPSDDRPRQGMAQAIHDPPVWRGPDNHGVPAMRCDTCHQTENSPHARVPGAPSWHLAPLEMGWIGRSEAEICAQLKDPARNGGKSLDEIHTHLAEDALVAWGWDPGHGRTPAPGSQAALAALAKAWIDTGAACPEGDAR